MKRSKFVPLILIGCSAALVGCGGGQDAAVTQRNYNSLQDCKRDWDEKDCSTTNVYGHSGGGYYGPRYYWDRDVQQPMAVNNDGSRTPIANSRMASEFVGGGRATTTGYVRTGGFGATAHGISGSGGG